MKPSLEKLQKYLNLESEREYDNQAVMGGLSSMLSSWEAEARVDEVPEDIIQVVIGRLRDYNRLSMASREDALEGLSKRISRQTGENTAKKKPSQKPARKPAPKKTEPPAQEAGPRRKWGAPAGDAAGSAPQGPAERR
ncbi:MAG: hypothetical protein N2D54_04410, partial [Chloroflexota bacterium]